MKLTTVFILLACLHLSAKTTAQKLTISVKNGSLESVFAFIEQKTGFNVFYNVMDLQHTKPVNIEVKDGTVDEVLQQALKGQALTFFIQEKTIFIKKEVVKVVFDAAAPGETGPPVFTGVVKSESGTPLAGATVYIPKLKQSATTGLKGEFSLKNMPDGEYEVEISFVGYATYKTTIVVVNHSGTLTAALKQSMSQLDETVVKGYYITTERLNTGDVTTVKSDVIEAQPVSDPIQALEGRVPGLYIQQTSGVPGAYATIQIRGQNSIANGNDPLYLVDGVPYSSVSLSSSFFNAGALGTPSPTFNSGGGGMSPFNVLDPGDIESITVLKDADATAIYGSRGANGVVLITTKHGKAGATHVDLSVYTGSGEPSRTMHLLNTSQYLQMRREAFNNDGLTVPSITTNPTDNNYDIDGVWDTTRNANWQKLLIEHMASFTNAQASVTGGNTNTQFLVGGGYNIQGTAFPGNYKEQKSSAHISLTHTSTDQHFYLQIGANYGYDDNDVPSVDLTSNITLAPDVPVLFDKNGNLNWQPLNGTFTFWNPLSYTLDDFKSATYNLNSNLNLGYKILPVLQLKSAFGYNRSEMSQTQILPASDDPPPYDANPYYNSSEFATTNSTTWSIEPQLDFQQRFGPGKLAVLLGSTFQQISSNSLGERAYDFASAALISDPLAAVYPTLLGAKYTLYRYDALYGRINYDWGDKYLVNLTARRDGSSRFGPGKQFGNFGAAGIGWIFTKENFIQKNLPFLSFGKLRGSYGTTGNDQIGDYQYLSTYSPNSPLYQGINTLTPTQLTNPYFAWELVKKIEGGIDLGFIHDRMLLGISIYRNRSGNQLVDYPLPVFTGSSGVEYNLPATVQNSGIEITATTINIRTKNFNWTTAINLSMPSNKLVAFQGLANSPYSTSYVVGKSIFIQRRYHFTGVDPQTGVYSFASKNADGAPSFPQDAVNTKPVTQKYYGGLNNKFTYKGFELDLFVQYVNQLGLNYQVLFSSPGLTGDNQPTAVLNRWKFTGNLTNIQRFGTTSTTNNPYNYLNSSDEVIGDASFIRLKNLALYYQVPAGIRNKMHVQNLRLYALCQNLFTITHYAGLDPESRGLNLPPLRMITGGLQVSF